MAGGVSASGHTDWKQNASSRANSFWSFSSCTAFRFLLSCDSRAQCVSTAQARAAMANGAKDLAAQSAQSAHRGSSKASA